MKILKILCAVVLLIFSLFVFLGGTLSLTQSNPDIGNDIGIMLIVGGIPFVIGIYLLCSASNHSYLFDFSGFGALFFGKTLALAMANKENWQSVIDARQNSPKPFSPGRLHHFGLAFYKKYLDDALTKSDLTDADYAQLEKIQEYFKLSPQQISFVKRWRANRAVKHAVLSKIADQTLTDDDKKDVLRLARFMELSEDDARGIIRNCVKPIIDKDVEKAMSDHRVSPEEEKQITDVARQLGVSEADIPALLKKGDWDQYNYFIQLYQVEHGNMPSAPSPVPLSAGEVCYLAVRARRLESKMETTGYSGGSHGVSIHIAKGLNYRVGSFRGHAVREEVTEKYPGQFVVTSKKIVFAGDDGQSATIPLDKISYLSPYSDGVKIVKGSTDYDFEFSERAELAGLVIAKAASAN